MIDSHLYEDELIPPQRERAQIRAAEESDYRAHCDRLFKIALEGRQQGWSRAEVFRRQAECFADFEEPRSIRADFFAYYPTYSDMSMRQLQAYFSWRTKIRRGLTHPGPVGFSFVYIYELLNVVGVPTPEAAYDRLLSFWKKQRLLDSLLDCYVPGWLDSFAIWYGVDRPFLSSLFKRRAQKGEKDVTALLSGFQGELCREASIFNALCRASSYRIEKSAFYQKESALVETFVAQCWDALLKTLGTEALRDWFTEEKVRKYSLFRTAVFDATRLPSVLVYRLSDGRSTVELSQGGIAQITTNECVWRRPQEVSAFLRACESALRVRKGGRPLKYAVEPAVERAIQSVLAEKDRAAREAANPARSIDLSLLAGIREDALVTQNRLIVEEPDEAYFAEEGTPFAADLPQDRVFSEPIERAAPVPSDQREAVEPSQALPQSEAAAVPADNAALEDEETLSAAERGFLTALLAGLVEAQRLTQGVPLSMAVDAMNEKLLPIFGDTVIEWQGGAPAVIEDYADDLAAYLGEFE